MRGRIWTCNKEELLETLRKSKSMREALRHLGYCGSGGSATNFKKRLAKEGIDPTVVLIPNQPKIRAAADLDKIFGHLQKKNWLAWFGRYLRLG